MAATVEPDIDTVADKRLFWADVLAECNAILGPAPRRFSFWERISKSKMPFWAYMDALHKMEGKRWSVLSEGTIVWGYLVQGNVALFSPGLEGSPADVLFSPTPSIEVNPEYLSEFAGKLYKIKTDAIESEKDTSFYKHIQNDRDRAQGIKCPISNNNELMVSTILINRSDLPYGFLIVPFFPLAVFPDGVVSIVPEKYWPEVFVRLWTENCHPHLKWKIFGQKLLDGIVTTLLVIAGIMLLIVVVGGIVAIVSSR